LLTNRQKNDLKQTVTEFKKTLPEDMSTSSAQQDTMELGRCLIDKMSNMDVEFIS
jgi:hypothetical protein